jgi:hypothetical protein
MTITDARRAFAIEKIVCQVPCTLPHAANGSGSSPACRARLQPSAVAASAHERRALASPLSRSSPHAGSSSGMSQTFRMMARLPGKSPPARSIACCAPAERS